jgi:D-erythronate 2-dehydrogenase
MKIAITGGGGFLGRRLAAALLANPAVEHVALADVTPVRPVSDDPRVSIHVADLSDKAAAERLVQGADLIFHLAAVVSGQAEADFDLGMRVNLDAARNLLEAARARGRCPRLVFASSLAVFGAPMPPVIGDDTAVHPQSSYGTQKAVGELLVADYTRKGFIDGRIVRLPTVCVRPGKPNAAASSFVSGIIREPLHGEDALCPVSRDQELWLSSPHAAVKNLVHAGRMEAGPIGPNRIINLPGITVSVAGMISALEKVAGPAVAARITFGESPMVRRIVSGWPSRFDVARALGLGFSQDSDFESLIRGFLADEEAGNTTPS